MQTRYYLLLFTLLLCLSAQAQKLSTRSGYVRFFSETPLENIEAINEQSSSILNLENGQFAFLVPIKGFVFEKALMQEHFNENYLESGQFPNATFKGQIRDFAALDLEVEGKREIVLVGTMEIHGVSRQVEIPVTLMIAAQEMRIEGELMVKASDYAVKIPAAKKDNINNELALTVKYRYAR